VTPDALISSNVALEQLGKADERWGAAVRAFDRYPTRLRTLAQAAEHESRALTLADLANVTWKARRGASKLRLAYELDEQSARPGTRAEWAQFDKAIAGLGLALEGESITALAAAFSQVAAAASGVADAIERQQDVPAAAG
jgi:hypothetical protein